MDSGCGGGDRRNEIVSFFLRTSEYLNNRLSTPIEVILSRLLPLNLLFKAI